MARLLIVEDDMFVRGALIRELTQHGHTVRSASTALDGLREIAQDPPEAVILDLGLPDLDGSEALQMTRAISDVPVIIATARDDEAEIVRLLLERVAGRHPLPPERRIGYAEAARTVRL